MWLARLLPSAGMSRVVDEVRGPLLGFPASGDGNEERGDGL